MSDTLLRVVEPPSDAPAEVQGPALLRHVRDVLASHGASDLAWFRQRYPADTPSRTADRLVRHAARAAALEGAASGASRAVLPLQAWRGGDPAWTGADPGLDRHLRLASDLFAAHGVPLDPADREDQLLVLALSVGATAEELAARGLVQGGRLALEWTFRERLPWWLAREVLGRLGFPTPAFSARGMLAETVLPLWGLATGGALRLAGAQAVGRAVTRVARRRAAARKQA